MAVHTSLGVAISPHICLRPPLPYPPTLKPLHPQQSPFPHLCHRPHVECLQTALSKRWSKEDAKNVILF